MQVTLQLRPTEAHVLARLAFDERRTPRRQAEQLLAEALARRIAQTTGQEDACREQAYTQTRERPGEPPPGRRSRTGADYRAGCLQHSVYPPPIAQTRARPGEFVLPPLSPAAPAPTYRALRRRGYRLRHLRRAVDARGLEGGVKFLHPDYLTPKRPAHVRECPTCGAEPMRCPACRSPRVVLVAPGGGYWATCRDCGFPIGAM